MGASGSRGCGRAGRGLRMSNPLRAAGGGLGLRGALLASASLIALASFSAPDPARAACNGVDQTFSKTVKGPILSTGGKITVNAAGVINGGPTGVDAASCSISTLSNLGVISGGVAATSKTSADGVLNRQTITTLTNNGRISGGSGGASAPGGGAIGNGGTIGTLTNAGMINGGSGVQLGGAGLLNDNTITTLMNTGTISGGQGGFQEGGTGVENISQMGSLTNAKGATISGGNALQGGTGGAGVRAS
jgi:hypothetical protein